MNIARTSVLATIVALAAFLVACGSATPPASPQPEHDPTATPAPQAAFHIVRIPTEGRFSEPVVCRHIDRASFTVRYLHGTISEDDWLGGAHQKPLGRGRYGEYLQYSSPTHSEPATHAIPDYDMGLIGSRIYVLGVPSERVLVSGPKPGQLHSDGACFVGQLTDARLPP